MAGTALLNWGPSLSTLGNAFRVIAMDHHGHGRGLQTRSRFRLEDCADDAAALAQVLGAERFIPVGYSMGGPIAQLAWKRHPQRVAGLVLCATAGRFANQRQRQVARLLAPILTGMARAAPSGHWEESAGRMLEGVQDPEMKRRIQEEIRDSRPVALVEAAAALADFDSRRWIGDVDVPTAVVITTQDDHIAPAVQTELAIAIPGAQQHPVSGNHYVCVTRPDLFVPTLFRACKSVAMRASVTSPVPP